jgi:hypothetical protein
MSLNKNILFDITIINVDTNRKSVWVKHTHSYSIKREQCI